MSSNDVDDIVKNFVANDLSSLDQIGGTQDSFTLSPHLTQASPDPSKSASNSSEASSAKTGPKLSNVGGSVQPRDAAIGGTKDGLGQNGEASLQTPKTTDTSAFATPRSTLSVEVEKTRQVSAGSSDAAKADGAKVNGSDGAPVERRQSSFGDKFKKFGRRITSGSKK